METECGKILSSRSDREERGHMGSSVERGGEGRRGEGRREWEWGGLVGPAAAPLHGPSQEERHLAESSRASPAAHGHTHHLHGRSTPVVLSPEEQALAASNDYNFDHPGAFDFELLVTTLRKLKQGKSVKIPVYDFTTHGRQKDWKNVYGASVIIFEGIMSFADKELLQLLDMKIFVDTDSDIRLVRRLRRDITERGRDIEGVIKQYNKFVKPAFEQYIEPTMRLADIVVPRGGGNMVAIDLIVQHVHSQLEERELSVRALLASAQQTQPPLPQTLSVLESTPQLHYLRLPKDISEDHVILMDSTVSTGAAAMMAVRVLLKCQIISSHSLSFFLLIATDQTLTAVDVCVAEQDHEVQEDKIVLVSLLMAELGVHSVAYAFPKVKIITSAVDKSLDDSLHVIPGIGDFGDRYFGTDGSDGSSDEEDTEQPSY
ncbi:hypothetical protein INR49_003514 [Caranx melampygus]|nr:hypothetical protein INR49_003514 [Caranx melampygus]